MPNITLRIEDTRQDLDRAALIIRAIRALHPDTATVNTADVPAGTIARWFNRLGSSRNFWERAARHAQTHSDSEWTFDDLADSPEDKKTLRALHRTWYRAIKAEGATNPLNSWWDSKKDCQVYQMPNSVRDEILHLLEQEERQDELQVSVKSHE